MRRFVHLPQFLALVLCLIAWALFGPGTVSAQAKKNTGGVSSVKWSPDGTTLVFMATWDGDLEIYTMKLDGSEIRQLTENEITDHTPSFTNDGRSVLYVSTPPELAQPAYQGIYIVDLESGESAPYIGLDGWMDYAPQQVADGRITFNTLKVPQYGKRMMYAWDPDTGQTELLIDPPGIDEFGSWSPRKDRFLFATNRDWPGEKFPNERHEIYVANWDGSNQKRLTVFPNVKGGRNGNAYPRFAPDGRHFVYRSDRNAKDPEKDQQTAKEYYLFDLQTSTEVKLAIPGDIKAELPSFSPDGMKIAYGADPDGDARFEILITEIDLDTGKIGITRTIAAGESRSMPGK